MRLAAGHRLGPYEIVGTLGAGGMGEVYRARDTRLGREVAIKVLPAERMADDGRKRRFVQEARAASALNHPHIVTIYEIESAEGVDFIVIELVPGKTLDALIPRQGMRLGEVLRVAIPLADALAAAHAAGIVHRDLKPANVMVTPEGVVKVLDFGLAKLTQGQEASGEDSTTLDARAGLSHPGAVAGTPAYMSPEQASGGKVDARSDIFSFGAVLYEMVTADGRRVAFDSFGEDGHWDIWTIDAEGGPPRRLTADSADHNMPSWSSDGRFVYCSSNHTGAETISRVPAAGGSEEQVTSAGGGRSQEAADGKTLFVQRRSRGRSPLLAVSLSGGAERIVIDCVPRFGFAVATAGIFHLGCNGDETSVALSLLDPATGRDRLIGKLERPAEGLTISADGKTVLYTKVAGEGSDLVLIENFR